VLDSKIGDRTIKGADIDSLIHEVANALVAAGTTRTDALALTAHVNVLATVGSGTGVVLPAMVPNQQCIVFNNDGTNAVQVYAPGSATIDGVAGATGVPLTHAKRCAYYCIAAGVIISAQLGAVSA
jgi:hypothetical protein